jgi:ABC-type phosphate transport system substrate-binding protein
MRIFIALAVAGLVGCSGGSSRYLETDVLEVHGFQRTYAKDIQMSGGLMQTGTLEYSGSTDVADAFNEYVEAMKGNGWTIANVDSQGDKSVATMRKDNRTCNIEFSKSGSKTKAHIQVGTTK